MVNYNFSKSEKEQVKSLIKDFFSGRLSPIDCRKYTKKVRTFAQNSYLIVRGSDESLEYYYESEGLAPKRWYVNNFIGKRKFCVIYNSPVDILWEMVAPILEDHEGWESGTGIGYSITRNSKWLDLGVQPSSNEFHTNEDLNEMIRILERLVTFGHIIFQRVGSIWNIAILKR